MRRKAPIDESSCRECAVAERLLTETRRLPDALRLEQVPMIVPSDDHEPRAHSESNERPIRVPESHAVDVMTPRARHHLTDLRVAGHEAVHDRRLDLPRA